MIGDSQTKPGKVYLVGAGPGDPNLLTLRAITLLQSCDVVCYDELISAAILSMVPAGVELLPTGYRGYCGNHIGYGMHPLVIEQALLGKEVVRLKAGDPFIFGRATQECLELRDRGIDYEVVPGITAALGAAAYAGFPLTSTGIASDVTFASGHQSSKTISSWAAMGSSTGTLVLYMGAKKLAQHARTLIQHGRDPNTPVAHISAATSAKQVVTTGTLDTIGSKVLSLNCHAPALVIMGTVVELAEHIGWRDKLPKSGEQVLVLGGDEADALVAPLLKAGAEVVRPPLVETHYFIAPEDWQRLYNAEQIAFLDASSVESWWRHLQKIRFDLRSAHWQIFALSDAAAEKLQQLGLFDCQRITDLDRPQLCLVLGGSGDADISLWSRRLNPLRFELPTPDVLIVTDEQVLKHVLEKQPDLLTGVEKIYNADSL